MYQRDDYCLKPFPQELDDDFYYAIIKAVLGR
jgi:hypothetical protein